jgi:hypothetical protein
MRFLSILTFFAGYALLYASVANHGKFALHPWNGLFTDAYSDPTAASKAPDTTDTTPSQSSSTASPGVIQRGGGKGGSLHTRRGATFAPGFTK